LILDYQFKFEMNLGMLISTELMLEPNIINHHQILKGSFRNKTIYGLLGE